MKATYWLATCFLIAIFWPFGISRLNYLLMFLTILDPVHIFFEILGIIFYFLFPFGVIPTITEYKKKREKTFTDGRERVNVTPRSQPKETKAAAVRAPPIGSQKQGQTIRVFIAYGGKEARLAPLLAMNLKAVNAESTLVELGRGTTFKPETMKSILIGSSAILFLKVSLGDIEVHDHLVWILAQSHAFGKPVYVCDMGKAGAPFTPYPGSYHQIDVAYLYLIESILGRALLKTYDAIRNKTT